MRQKRIEKGEGNGIMGRFQIRTYRAGTKELLRVSPWIHNRVVSSDGHGRNLILRELVGNAEYGIQIDSAKIGTGTTAPVDGDTDLETAVLSNIELSDSNVNNDEATLEFFIPDGDLANDTYTEFGLFIGAQLFARSLITPTHNKSVNEDTTISYSITISHSDA